MLDHTRGLPRQPACVAHGARERDQPAQAGGGEDPDAEVGDRLLLDWRQREDQAWRGRCIGRLPVVQCVQVRRRGNFVAGISVALVSIGAPI